MSDRGIVYASKSRIMTKTNLPKVLLASNPQMERELRKKLDSISLSQQRRERTLDWNQRQFLVSQIFDDDFNLRFTLHQRARMRETSAGGATERLERISVSRGKNDGVFADKSKKLTAGAKLGIFLPPLHPHND